MPQSPDTPTPCRPPDTEYPLESPPNLPPACSTVSTVSRADLPVAGCTSVGMPLQTAAGQLRGACGHGTVWQRQKQQKQQQRQQQRQECHQHCSPRQSAPAIVANGDVAGCEVQLNIHLCKCGQGRGT